jgi:serine/threonine-protein kinase
MHPAPEVGQILAGKYQVERVLGQGGMGVVLAARHLQLEQRVALKFLLPEAARRDDLVQRFLREARAAVRLRNEYVAKILDVGTLDTGSPYIVMEFLDGQDLEARVEQRGPLPVEEAAEFLLQACEGLADAHKLGIIHRDLKPANLFVSERSDGSPCIKILDFGISKVTDEIGEGMTRTNEVMGSPHFMSPEQLRASRLADARSDIWALGVILFQLLTGKHVFDRGTLPELCTAIILEPPPTLRSVRPGLPAALDEVCLRCLEKDPARRYQTVAELAAALAPFGPSHAGVSAERASRVLGSPSSRASLPAPVGVAFAATEPPSATAAGRAPWLLGAAAGVAALVLVGYGLTRGADGPGPAGAPSAAVSAGPASSGAAAAPAETTSAVAPVATVIPPHARLDDHRWGRLGGPEGHQESAASPRACGEGAHGFRRPQIEG